MPEISRLPYSFALRSHELAVQATDEGRLPEEIVSVTVSSRKGDTLVEVDEGPYQGLRLVVDSARVYLAEGLAFEDGSRSGTLKVPSGQTSGIKVKLADVIPAQEGDTTAVTVDFDVDQNFVIQRNPQTGAVKKILFTPVLREKSREGSGS